MLCDPLGCVWLCVCVCVVRCVCIRKYGGRLFSPPLNLVEWKFRTFDGNMLFRLGYSVWRFWYSLCVQYCMVKCVMCEIEHSLRITSTVWTGLRWRRRKRKNERERERGREWNGWKKTHKILCLYVNNGWRWKWKCFDGKSVVVSVFSTRNNHIFAVHYVFGLQIHNDLWIHT